MLKVITVIDYDKQTQFNNVSVEKINQAWGDTPYILVYTDGEFSGIAHPKGIKTLEQWQTHHQESFSEQEAREEAESLKVSEESAEREAILLGLAELYDLLGVVE